MTYKRKLTWTGIALSLLLIGGLGCYLLCGPAPRLIQFSQAHGGDNQSFTYTDLDNALGTYVDGIGMVNYKKKLVNLKDHRQQLRKKRKGMLKPKQLLKHLETEKAEVEIGVKKIQAGYYVDRTISEGEYEFQFKLLTERLAEIEGEMAVIDVEKGEKVVSETYKSGIRPLRESSERNVISEAPMMGQSLYDKLVGWIKRKFGGSR